LQMPACVTVDVTGRVEPLGRVFSVRRFRQHGAA
jgi:hypothetical protein